MTTFSIITVTLNNLENLKHTFHSLLDQTDKDFEWIIKDGNSLDFTNSYYKSDIEPSGLISKMVSLKDSSIYEAMNQAIGYANNQYVLFLNAGDCLAENETIHKIRGSIKGDVDYSLLYGDSIDVTDEGINIYKKSRKLEYLSNSLPTSHQAILYNRQLFDSFKYSTEYKIASDYDLTARIYYSGHTKYLRLDFPVCKFYLGGESTTNRQLLLTEGYLIHRSIVKNSFVVAKIKFYKRMLTFFILDKLPRIYQLLRSYNRVTVFSKK